MWVLVVSVLGFEVLKSSTNFSLDAVRWSTNTVSSLYKKHLWTGTECRNWKSAGLLELFEKLVTVLIRVDSFSMVSNYKQVLCEYKMPRTIKLESPQSRLIIRARKLSYFRWNSATRMLRNQERALVFLEDSEPMTTSMRSFENNFVSAWVIALRSLVDRSGMVMYLVKCAKMKKWTWDRLTDVSSFSCPK